LEQSGIKVHAVNIPLDVEKNPNSEAGLALFAGAFKVFPKARFIVVDHGPVTSAVGSILKSLGKKPGEIIVGGFDLSAKTVDAVREGYVGLVHDQQPYLQGYLPVLQACLTKKYGFSGLYVDTGVGLVDNSNIEVLADLARRKIR
jgi:simple sugar transport system substrate-binding protein